VTLDCAYQETGARLGPERVFMNRYPSSSILWIRDFYSGQGNLQQTHPDQVTAIDLSGDEHKTQWQTLQALVRKAWQEIPSGEFILDEYDYRAFHDKTLGTTWLVHRLTYLADDDTWYQIALVFRHDMPDSPLYLTVDRL